MSTTISDHKPSYKPFKALAPEDLITEEAVAHYLNISSAQVTDLIQQNRLPYLRFGWKTVRILVSDLRDFLNKNRVEATASLPPSRKSNLNDAQVAEVRKLRESGATLSSIAGKFHITESSVSRICAGNRRQKATIRMAEAAA
jgi:excisionase family DNA binding protein